MKKHILFPVDLQPTKYHLSDYENLLSHVDSKRFSAFFLKDFTKSAKGKTTVINEQDKSALQNSLQDEAKKLDLDINFINSQSNSSGLMNQSKFADLAIISPITHDNMSQLIQSFPDQNSRSVYPTIHRSNQMPLGSIRKFYVPARLIE